MSKKPKQPHGRYAYFRNLMKKQRKYDSIVFGRYANNYLKLHGEMTRRFVHLHKIWKR